MYSESVLVDVADILSSFNTHEIAEFVKEQLHEDDDGTYATPKVDQFLPIYVYYNNTLSNYNLDTDEKNEFEDKFIEVCRIFLDEIFEKFDISLDSNWLNENSRFIPALTVGMYDFFVLDLYNNIMEAFQTYIKLNYDHILKAFEGMSEKRDASTLVTRSNSRLTPEMSIIAANIYDVCVWIMDQLDIDKFFRLLDPSYIPFMLIYRLYNECILQGDFMKVIQELYRTNSTMQGKIGFNLFDKITNGSILDPFSKERAS
jgi:hypothetical protein